MALAGGFLAAWAACSFAAYQYGRGYQSEAGIAEWWATMAWYMIGGAILSTVAAVHALPGPSKRTD